MDLVLGSQFLVLVANFAESSSHFPKHTTRRHRRRRKHFVVHMVSDKEGDYIYLVTSQKSQTA